MFIAGIDGGGTRTRLELRDENNGFLRREEFGPFNINAIGEKAFRKRLREVFEACGNMARCKSICFGGAGVSNPLTERIIREELPAAGFFGTWYLCGDQEIALRGAMDTPGIAVIAGTGSICFGKNSKGEATRSGGYGHLIDDGGSGYALGRDVLRCAVRTIDGRSHSTGVLKAVYDRLDADSPEQIVSFVYSPDTDKSAIASFAPIALEQAAIGDPDAQAILRQGAGELFAMVQAVQQRLDLHGCRIALLGGLLSGENPYRKAAADALTYLGTVVPPAHDALWGAAQTAWERQGDTLHTIL